MPSLPVQENALPGIEVQNEHGVFLMIETSRPLKSLRSDINPEDILQAGGESLVLATHSNEFADFDAERALFIDTETTGLAGGTGTYAFLIGVGFIKDSNFIVRQYFMRDLSEEKAMMANLSELFDAHEWSVTYNGRSFDLPLLRTRFIMSRQRPRLDHMGHLDLLHSARRLWRDSPRVSGGLSLGNIETSLFEFERPVDVPSWTIPDLYLNYLRDHDATSLLPVLAHNVEDIVTMAALLGVVDRTLSTWESDNHIDPYIVASIGKNLERMGDSERAIQAYRRALTLGLNSETSNRVAFDLSIVCKRHGRWEEAVTLWHQIAGGRGRTAALACIELAKYFEHRVRHLNSARDMCKRVRNLYNGVEHYWGGQISEWEVNYRTLRLNRKLAKIAPAPSNSYPGRQFIGQN